MRKVKRVGQQQRKSSRAGYQSSTADGPPAGGEHRRRPSEQEQALTQKNYRLAKELSELRVRLRDEMRTVTKLTMENMNLGSRCREHMSENLHLRRELSALQQNKNFSHVPRPQQRSANGPQSNSPPVSLASIAATSPPLSPTQESYPQHHNDSHKRQPNGPVSPRHLSMPPPDGTTAQPVRQPRRPVSKSFDDLNEDHLQTQTQLPRRSNGQKILKENIDVSSKDVFSNAIEVIPRPDSPIEVLDEPDEFEKWTQITPPSPPVSPGRRQSPRSTGKSSISFTPELLGDEKLPGAAFGTPEQNAFGDFIGPSHGSPSFGRSFKQKSDDDFDDLSLDSQQAFDASFAMAFPNTFDVQTHKPEGPPSLPSQDFGDSDIFSDDDPFFPPYKVSERNRYPSSNSDVGQEQRQASGHTNAAKSDPHTSEVNAKLVPISPRSSNSASSPKNLESEMFPVSPLDELDQIAMSSFAMTSMSTEATVGNNLEESKGITKEESVAPSSRLPKTACTTSARVERYNVASESSKKKEITSKINRKSPSSSHSPSLVLRRLHERRAQEKEQKALKEAAAASPTNSIPPSDESSPRSLEVHSPRSNGSATQTVLVSGMVNVITDEDKQGPAGVDDTSFSDSPSDEGGNIMGKHDENESSSPKQEIGVAKIQEDPTILDATREKEGGPSLSIFKATHPSRGKLPNQNTSSHSENVAPSSSPKNVECSDRSKESVHKLPSNSIQAEIRRLDAIATSQANSTGSNPLSGRRSTRSVKHPISYKEPSVGAKLRQGDIFFPRKEEKDAEDDNQNPAKNAGEVLQDLAES